MQQDVRPTDVPGQEIAKMSNRSTRFIGSTLGIVTGGAIAAIGIVHVIHLSLIQLF
jgi:hypothetical protein